MSPVLTPKPVHAIRTIAAVIHTLEQNNIYMTDDDTLDGANHVYSYKVLLGIIRNAVYEGLGLPLPDIKF